MPSSSSHSERMPVKTKTLPLKTPSADTRAERFLLDHARRCGPNIPRDNKGILFVALDDKDFPVEILKTTGGYQSRMHPSQSSCQVKRDSKCSIPVQNLPYFSNLPSMSRKNAAFVFLQYLSVLAFTDTLLQLRTDEIEPPPAAHRHGLQVVCVEAATNKRNTSDLVVEVWGRGPALEKVLGLRIASVTILGSTTEGLLGEAFERRVFWWMKLGKGRSRICSECKLCRSSTGEHVESSVKAGLEMSWCVWTRSCVPRHVRPLPSVPQRESESSDVALCPTRRAFPRPSVDNRVY